MKNALLIIDLQNDYWPDGRFPLDRIEAAGANAARLLADFRAKGLPVIHVRHVNPKPDAPFFAKDTPGAEINPAVAPKDGEPVVVKNFPNAFRETGLKAMLDAEGIEALTVCGAMSLMCVDATVRAAADLGLKVTVAHDACAARALAFDGVEVPAPQVHAAYMAALGMSYAAMETTDALVG